MLVECGPSDGGGGKGMHSLLLNNWFRRFLVGHSHFGWTHLAAVCSVCL